MVSGNVQPEPSRPGPPRMPKLGLLVGVLAGVAAFVFLTIAPDDGTRLARPAVVEDTPSIVRDEDRAEIQSEDQLDDSLECPLRERLVSLASANPPSGVSAVVDGPWVVTDLARSRCDALLNAMTAGGPGLVAVGSAMGAKGVTVAAVWTSSDGATWERVSNAAALRVPGRDAVMQDVANVGSGLVAVGTSCGEGHDCRPELWRATLSTRWARLSSFEESLAGGARVEGVVALRDTIVVRGAVGESGAIWTISPGGQWDESLRTPPGQIIEGVAVHKDGSMAVAWGRDRGKTVLWYSEDARAWVQLPYDEEIFGGAISWGWLPAVLDVIPAPSGFVAVGQVAEPFLRPAAWSSEDGKSWERTYVGDDTGHFSTAWQDGVTMVAWGPDVALRIDEDGVGAIHAVGGAASPNRKIQVIPTFAGTSVLLTDGRGFAQVWTRPRGRL